MCRYVPASFQQRRSYGFTETESNDVDNAKQAGEMTRICLLDMFICYLKSGIFYPGALVLNVSVGGLYGVGDTVLTQAPNKNDTNTVVDCFILVAFFLQ